MNGNVLALLQQSVEEYKIYWELSELDTVTIPQQITDRFAELIIKECIGDFEKKITIRYAGDQKSMDVGYGMELVIDSIKRKFGMV